MVNVQVTDNGIGIDKKYFEKVFEVFQRLHSQDQFPGTGIGLSVVRKACELQDATVSLESALGVGSTFSVHLKRVCSTHADPPLVAVPYATV